MTDSQGTVRVVGTAHVSAESVREVEDAIDEERPDVVAVELDEGRYRQLQGESPDDLEPGDLLEGNTVFQFLAYWMLSYVQTRMGEKFDVQPGAEMLAAVETAEDLGLDIALVDRDIQETIQRFWARMTILERLRLVGSLAFGITDPRIAGVTFGVTVGLILGPIVGLFGGSLGVTDPILVRVTGGTLLAMAVGYVLMEVGTRVLDETRGILLGIGGGLAAGGILGVGLGLTDPLVTRYVGEFFVTAVGSMVLGLAGGLGVGLVAAAAMDVLGVGLADADEFEDFDIDELTDTDVVSMLMDEFREFSPGGAEALIDERDAYIAHHLVRLRDQGEHVLAVVGAGHREGIEAYLEHPERLPPMASLTGTSPGGGLIPWGKVVGFGITGVFLGFFFLLFMAGVRDLFLLKLFAAWFAINGVFAASLARAAGARWPSALVGGAVAWMTSINPLLAPGWFTGYVELRYTTVNVADISRLNDILSDEEKPVRTLVSEMFGVPLFRLIMIVAMTNIGSIIASLLFVAYVLPLFGAELGGVDGVTALMLQGARNSAEVVVRWVA